MTFESSQPVLLKSVKSEDIGNRRLTKREAQVLRRIAARQADGDDLRVNLKDMPRLTDRQLATMARLRDVRPGGTGMV